MIVILSICFYALNTICLAFKPLFFRSTPYYAVCLTIDVLFLIDILVLFRTSKLNIKTGEEITDPWHLAKNYFLSIRFWADIISVIPFEIMNSHELLILISLLKIYRVRRINKLIENINVVSKTKTVRLLLLISTNYSS